ncbi:MAG TPA: PCYCGC motif-containing (lipo)protein [Gemmatimonadaceae bacterium]
MQHPVVRREFVRVAFGAAAALLIPFRTTRAMSAPAPHPTPRPGITAAKVLRGDQVGNDPKLAAIFDGVRTMPEIVDGIGCQCGCAASEGFYSLLTCYEGESAMARSCAICQGQGALVVRLHRDGKSLDEIRRAIDAKFG